MGKHCVICKKADCVCGCENYEDDTEHEYVFPPVVDDPPKPEAYEEPDDGLGASRAMAFLIVFLVGFLCGAFCVGSLVR
jgi:hypothetical protein